MAAREETAGEENKSLFAFLILDISPSLEDDRYTKASMGEFRLDYF